MEPGYGHAKEQRLKRIENGIANLAQEMIVLAQTLIEIKGLLNDKTDGTYRTDCHHCERLTKQVGRLRNLAKPREAR